MSSQVLRDNQGRVIGTMTSNENGVIEARDANGRYLGSYDPRTEITRNSRGRVVGLGNLLGTLIR